VPSAAEHYLGHATWQRLATALDQRWQANIRQDWHKHHERLVASRQTLAALDARHEAGDALTSAERFERAALMGQHHGAAVAIQELRTLVAADTTHAPAHLLLGVRLLEADDPEGIAWVERAMALDVAATGVACDAMLAYLKRHDAPADERDRWRDRAARFQTDVEAKKQEVHVLRATDTFEAVTITDDAKAALISVLARHEEIRRAYYVRKIIAAAPDLSYPALVVERPLYRMTRPPQPTALARLLVREAAVNTLAQRVFVIEASGLLRRGRLQQALHRTRGALIYDRRARPRLSPPVATDRESVPHPAAQAESTPSTVHPASEG
jgi:hypothetical protein